MQAIGGISRTELSATPDYRVQKVNNVETASKQARDNVTEEKKFSLDKEALTAEQKKIFEQELKSANESLMSNGKQLRFKYDEDANSLYVEVLDSKTQEVVVSLPPEFLIDLSKRMKELIGLFLDKKA